MREIVVDVRELPAPEPLEKILNTLPEIGEGSYMKVLHRMEPALLFPILKQNGFDFLLKKAGVVEVYIFLKRDALMQRYFKEA